MPRALHTGDGFVVAIPEITMTVDNKDCGKMIKWRKQRKQFDGSSVPSHSAVRVGTGCVDANGGNQSHKIFKIIFSASKE